MLTNKPELHLAFHVLSLQAYNSVSLVSLLACLSQLVYSLDVWPSAEWDTHTHTHLHTRRWFKSDLSVWRMEAEHSRSGGLYSAMNLNYGKHPHSQCLCRRASCQWYTLASSKTPKLCLMRGTPHCVTHKLKHRNEKTQRGARNGTGGAEVDAENALAPASSMTDASSSKEKAIKEREDGRKEKQEEARDWGKQRNGATVRDYGKNPSARHRKNQRVRGRWGRRGHSRRRGIKKTSEGVGQVKGWTTLVCMLTPRLR